MTTTRTPRRQATDDTYNGWSNRETWAVMLHVNNDEGLHNDAHDLARDCAPNVAETMDRFRDYVEDLLSPYTWRQDYGTPMPEGIESMREDVGSLWRVDWFECAESLLSDVTAL